MMSDQGPFQLHMMAQSGLVPMYQPQQRSFKLILKQQPENGKVTQGQKEKDRKPIDPPPIAQLVQVDENGNIVDKSGLFSRSPYIFAMVYLEPVEVQEKPSDPPKEYWVQGQTCSSLHRLKDLDNTDGAFFIWGDLACRKEGKFRFRIRLFIMHDEMARGWTDCECEAVTDVFTVHTNRSYPGLAESTFYTRSFSDQGVKVRLRKESRQLTTRKRNHEVANRGNRRSSEATEHTGGYRQPQGFDGPRGSVASQGTPYQGYEQGYAVENQEPSKRQREGSSTKFGSMGITVETGAQAGYPSGVSSYYSMANSTNAIAVSQISPESYNPTIQWSASGSRQLPPLQHIQTSGYSAQGYLVQSGNSNNSPGGNSTMATTNTSPTVASPHAQSNLYWSPQSESRIQPAQIRSRHPSVTAMPSSSTPPARGDRRVSGVQIGASYLQSHQTSGPMQQSAITGQTMSSSAEQQPRPGNAHRMRRGGPPDESSYIAVTSAGGSTLAQPSFAPGQYPIGANMYDQGTIRNHGLGTPLTADMRDGIPDPYIDPHFSGYPMGSVNNGMRDVPGQMFTASHDGYVDPSLKANTSN